MNKLYPLKFRPILKDKVWGGTRMKTMLGLDFSPLSNCGEAWVLSGVNKENSIVSNGFLKGNELNELVEIYMDELVGQKTFDRFDSQFPILVKFIDTKDVLSVQVHPGDELAAKRHGALSGKTEMWYVLHADDNAWLMGGFRDKTSKEEYLEALQKGKITEMLIKEEMKTGDAFYLPAGTIHALGPGVLLAEIQQTSDATYRIYDWDRTDAKGNPRELHTELATDAIDFTRKGSTKVNYNPSTGVINPLVHSPFFNTNLINLKHPAERDYSALDCFVIYLCTGGGAEVITDGYSVHLRAGETLLIPAIANTVTSLPRPEANLLEIYIP